jgi:hypothetical protein
LRYRAADVPFQDSEGKRNDVHEPVPGLGNEYKATGQNHCGGTDKMSNREPEMLGFHFFIRQDITSVVSWRSGRDEELSWNPSRQLDSFVDCIVTRRAKVFGCVYLHEDT